MTNATRKMLQREAVNTSGKLDTATRKANKAREDGKGWQLLLTNETIDKLEQQAQAIQEALTAHQTDPIMVLSAMITTHSLKVAARGRAIKDENGKLTTKINKKTGMEYSFTPPNITALRILQEGTKNADGILDDLCQSVALAIWEGVANNRISLCQVVADNTITIIPTQKGDIDAMRGLYNVVQNYLYTHQQRHYKREYIPVIDDNGLESYELVTKAMREYALGLNNVDKCGIFQELDAILNEHETAVLWAMYDLKTVERVTTTTRTVDGHKGVKTYVQRVKTLVELSTETGYTVQTVRTTQKNIRKKLSLAIAGEYIAPERKKELTAQAKERSALYPHSVAKRLIF